MSLSLGIAWFLPLLSICCFICTWMVLSQMLLESGKVLFSVANAEKGQETQIGSKIEMMKKATMDNQSLLDWLIFLKISENSKQQTRWISKSARMKSCACWVTMVPERPRPSICWLVCLSHHLVTLSSLETPWSRTLPLWDKISDYVNNLMFCLKDSRLWSI